MGNRLVGVTVLYLSRVLCAFLCSGEMMASRREKKEEYLAAPAIVGETSVLADCISELATRHAVTLYSITSLLQTVSPTNSKLKRIVAAVLLLPRRCLACLQHIQHARHMQTKGLSSQEKRSGHKYHCTRVCLSIMHSLSRGMLVTTSPLLSALVTPVCWSNCTVRQLMLQAACACHVPSQGLESMV